MCGIFGLILKPGSTYPEKSISKSLKNLALYSESRGKDSSGVAFRFADKNNINIIKGDIPVSELLESSMYEKNIQNLVDEYKNGNSLQCFGHARLVTNGSQLHEENNQPVIKDNIVIIHNGIITNVDHLWNQNQSLQRKFSIDTEIIPGLIRAGLNSGLNTLQASVQTFQQLEGTFSVAAMFADHNEFLLATNNGSLYYISNEKDFIFFASERYYLDKLLQQSSFAAFGNTEKVKQLKANDALLVNYNSFNLTHFKINQPAVVSSAEQTHQPFAINISAVENKKTRKEIVIDPSIYINRANETHLFKLLEFNADAIKKLKRCTKCLYPETFPFIYFDTSGVCNYCKNYKPKNQHKPISEIMDLVEPYRSKNGEPDCIVPFSGGRDSTFALHIVKNELKLNPIAYTYDWGMVTDLARRNIARTCGKLGVEHIIVSADIHWKRENIRKNINAWLAKPHLGMIPLFMAGDKFFFYYTNVVKKRNNVKLNLYGINHLENTDFKVGFAGIPPDFDKKLIYSMSLQRQAKLFSFVFSQFLQSPGYLNQSLLDSFGSIVARYFIKKEDYFHLFDYYTWDEREVEKVLALYNWEKAIDTNTSWRIGDGTAAFYNYIYYTVAGFSEFDTFRSNQIREGMLDRETALKLIEEENRPRYESMRWYLEIVGVDFEKAVRKINAIPKLYQV
jgi:glucosamine--fructose-6-phosphate aminotransferase (isomerizing)